MTTPNQAMPVVGTVPQFEAFANFEEWTEVLEAWFDSNSITNDAQRRSVLVTSIGGKAYHQLRALVQPNKPSDKSYAECKAALKGHYSPQKSEIIQRYKFNTYSQRTGASISQFVANLRQLSEGCNFTDLKNMLRDRLVLGVLM